MMRTRRWWARLEADARALAEDDTGDVPGWVLVTLMTAGLPVITKQGYLGRVPSRPVSV